jgi:hypothetical protein
MGVIGAIVLIVGIFAVHSLRKAPKQPPLRPWQIDRIERYGVIARDVGPIGRKR